MIELNRCPFCGSADVKSLFDGSLAWGYCTRCSAEGPICDDEPAAIEAWNHRAAATPAPEPDPVDAMNAREMQLQAIERGEQGAGQVASEPHPAWCSGGCCNPEVASEAVEVAKDAAILLAIDNVLCSVLPGVHYMDPPDGGDVTPLEQVQRMAKDAARYRWLRAFPNNLNHCVYGPTFSRDHGGGLLRRDDFLDAAIDAAMSALPMTERKE